MPQLDLTEPLASLNGGEEILRGSQALLLMQDAVGCLPAFGLTRPKDITDRLTPYFRRAADGWLTIEPLYTPIQPVLGRRRTNDFQHAPERISIELELGNQTCYSHDLLKLDSAYRNEFARAGVVVVLSVALANAYGWRLPNCYLSDIYAKEMLGVFGPSLRVPLVVLAIIP